MITVKLIGGLGNQLFQYGYARYLALQINADIGLDLAELERFDVKTHSKRHYSLDRFPNLRARPVTGRVLRILNHSNPIIRRLGRYHSPRFRYIRQDGLLAPDLIPQKHFNYYLDGYFVGHSHLDAIRKELMTDLADPRVECPDFQLIKQQIDEVKEPVFLHVRRGDYFSPELSDIYGICTADYYQKAINAIDQRVSTRHYFVFSDDINWVKSNLDLPVSTTFVSNPDYAPHEELLLMAACRHGIISNSTFSWWGAWLIDNPDKIIISPNQWVKGDSIPHRFDDLVPTNWLRIAP